MNSISIPVVHTWSYKPYRPPDMNRISKIDELEMSRSPIGWTPLDPAKGGFPPEKFSASSMAVARACRAPNQHTFEIVTMRQAEVTVVPECRMQRLGSNAPQPGV